MFQTPKNPEEWLGIAQEYEELLQFPNCLGAIDDKHIIQCPMNTNKEFFNYKGTFSVILLAIVDAKYRFIFVDIGCQDRISDGGVFSNSSLHAKLQKDQLHLPPNRKLLAYDESLP